MKNGFFKKCVLSGWHLKYVQLCSGIRCELLLSSISFCSLDCRGQCFSPLIDRERNRVLLGRCAACVLDMPGYVRLGTRAATRWKLRPQRVPMHTSQQPVAPNCGEREFVCGEWINQHLVSLSVTDARPWGREGYWLVGSPTRMDDSETAVAHFPVEIACFLGPRRRGHNTGLGGTTFPAEASLGIGLLEDRLPQST